MKLCDVYEPSAPLIVPSPSLTTKLCDTTCRNVMWYFTGFSHPNRPSNECTYENRAQDIGFEPENSIRF